MDRLQIVDLLGEKGHVNYVKYYLKELSHFDYVFYTTLEYSEEFQEFRDKIKIVSGKETKMANRWSFLLNQLVLHRNLKEYLSLDDRVVFLSYDTISLFLITCLRLLRSSSKIYLVNHNNFDRANSSIIKKACLRFLFKKYKMICIEEFMKNALKDFPHNEDLIVLPHPLVTKKKEITSNMKKEVIFIPSSGNSIENIHQLDEILANNKDITFVLKSKLTNIQLQHTNTISPYFDNYDDLLKTSRYVFLPLKYTNRVSAVFYEAAMNRCKIIMSNCHFAQAMKSLYPHLVSIIYEDDDILHYDEIEMEKDVDELTKNNSVKLEDILS